MTRGLEEPGLVPDWAHTKASTYGLDLKDHGGSGDCLFRTLEAQWVSKKMNERFNANCPTKRDCADHLFDLLHHDKNLQAEVYYDYLPKVRVTRRQKLVLEKYNAEQDLSADEEKDLLATQRKAAKLFHSNQCNQKVYADTRTCMALEQLLSNLGVVLVMMAVEQTFVNEFGTTVTNFTNGLNLVEHVRMMSQKPGESSAPIDQEALAQIDWSSTICVVSIMSSAYPAEDHFCEFAPSSMRQSKAAALDILASPDPIVVFNEDQPNVCVFQRVRRSGCRLQFSCEHDGNAEWWTTARYEVTALTPRAVDYLEKSAEKTAGYDVTQPISTGKSSHAAFCPEPVWCYPGHYNRISARCTTLRTDILYKGKYYLLKATWTRDGQHDKAPDGKQLSCVPATAVVLLDKGTAESLLPGARLSDTLIEATTTEGWTSWRHHDVGPGARPKARRRILPLEAVRSRPFWRWPRGTCALGSLCEALRARDLGAIAHALRIICAPFTPLSLLRHRLATASALCRLFEIKCLPTHVSSFEDVVQMLRGSDALLLLAQHGHAITLDLQSNLAFDVCESTPCLVPDDSQAAAGLLRRLTRTENASKSKLGGVVLLRRQRQTRRRGCRGGRRPCKAGAGTHLME